MSEEREIDDEEAALDLGTKLIEMADRIRTMDTVMPGTQATWTFEMDGIVYKVVVSITGRKPSQLAEA